MGGIIFIKVRHAWTRFSLHVIYPLIHLQKTKNKYVMKEFLSKAFICFSLLLLSNVIYAQSDNSIKVLLEKIEPENNDISKEENPSRDLDIYYILPTVLYNVADSYITIINQQVTFESVVYYIVDEFGYVLQQGEIALRKGDEVELHLPQLSIGTYKIVLDFSGDCFQGEFEVEQ